MLMLAFPWLVQFCLLSTRELRSSWFPWTLRVLSIGFGGRTSWNAGLHGRAFELFESYFSNRYLYVVTAGGISSSVPISAGVPQGGIWLPSPLLFSLYTRLIPYHSQLFSYANDHTLLNIKRQAICELNSDLAALVQYGVDW